MRIATQNLNTGELSYLAHRYSGQSAEFAERRERIHQVLKRLIKKGHDPKPVHDALALAVHPWLDERGVGNSKEYRRLVARARRDVARAVKSVRATLPEAVEAQYSDEEILEDFPHYVAPPPPPRRPGPSPQLWKQAGEALHAAGVGLADRTELLDAFGFIPDE